MGLTIDQLIALQPLVGLEPPQWLADGRIAFVSSLGGGTDLWSIEAEGGFPVRLTTGLGGLRFLDVRVARVSPDGRWIAYLSHQHGATEVWLWPTDGGASMQLTRLGANINAYSWAPDSRALALSCNRFGGFDIYHVAVPNGRATRLTRHALYEVYPVFTPDGREIVFVRLDERWQDHDVCAIPAGGTNSPDFGTSAGSSGQGTARTAGGRELAGGSERLITRDLDLFDYDYGKTLGYPLISPDGKTLLFRSQRSGWLNYWHVPMAGGEPRPLAPEAADQSEADWSPDGGSVAYCSNRNGTVSLCSATLNGGTVRTLVAPRLGMCALPKWQTAAGFGQSPYIAYLYQTPTTPLDLWVVDVRDGTTRQLTNSQLAGATARLIEPEKIVYPSFDGTPIHAYLYKPPQAADGRRYPVLIYTHGGPAMQWFDAFHNYMQYFAMRGYVVLAPNVRGSSGYGKAFETANYQDYGGGDLKDVVSGVEYLKTLDYVDPQRMAITGQSYGGYLSMAAVTFAPDVFQASIAHGGYCAQDKRMGQDGEDEQEYRHRQQLRYRLGEFESSREVYRRVSPLYCAKQTRTPIFVVHGEGERPRTRQSLEFVRALEKEDKTVRYKVYPNENYYVMGAANTRQMWLDMEEFLRESFAVP